MYIQSKNASGSRAYLQFDLTPVVWWCWGVMVVMLIVASDNEEMAVRWDSAMCVSRQVSLLLSSFTKKRVKSCNGTNSFIVTFL